MHAEFTFRSSPAGWNCQATITLANPTLAELIQRTLTRYTPPQDDCGWLDGGIRVYRDGAILTLDHDGTQREEFTGQVEQFANSILPIEGSMGALCEMLDIALRDIRSTIQHNAELVQTNAARNTNAFNWQADSNKTATEELWEAVKGLDYKVASLVPSDPSLSWWRRLVRR